MASATMTMAPAPVPEWNPTTEADKKLKESLQLLASSTDAVMLTPGPKTLMETKSQDEQQKKFLLQSKAYFDLKAYVMTGKDFPPSNDSFDLKITKEAFKRLESHEGVDKDIYALTKATVVGIGGTCSTFYNDHLHRIVQAGSVAKNWSQATLELLQESPEINLHAQLMVLCDLKYKTPADQDDAFFAAKSGADTSLLMLQQSAVDGKTEAQAIVTVLLRFRDDTKPFISKLKDLIPKYTTTPVMYKNKELKGYLAFLSTDYADAVAKLSTTLDQYNGKYDDWKTATGLAVGVGVSFGWVPIFGWIPLAFAAHNADNLHKAWGKLWDEYEALKRENENEARLIEFVTKMVAQFDDVDKKIQGAVDAVGTLGQVFQDQADSYEGIRSTLGFLRLGASSADAGNRKAFIGSKLKMSVKKLEELNVASRGFMEAILKEDKDTFKKS